MATPETWQKVKKYFRPNSLIDKWGDPNAIQDGHLLKLYDLRVWIGLPVIVNAGVKLAGHSTKSYHYSQIDKDGWERGKCATDILIPTYELSPFDLLLDVFRFNFTGVGYYPDWRYNGQKIGGLHLDSRPLQIAKDGSPSFKQARWMGINQGGKQIYIPLTFQNLMKYSSYDDGNFDSVLH